MPSTIGEPTNFPYGLSVGGVPAGSSSGYPANGGRHFYVNGNSGSDRNEGLAQSEALLTMAKAFTLIDSGDVIHVLGNIREQLDTPAGVFDVMVVGEGTRPRHADAHTGANGYQATCTWKAPASPAATTALCTVRQQGWVFKNILFVPPSDDAALDFIRDAASGDSERDSSHSAVIGCRFAGGSIGIKVSGTENVFNVLVQGNTFQDITTAISGGPYAKRWQILDNNFYHNVNHIVLAATSCVIARNFMGKWTTLSIVLTSGDGDNIVTQNYLSGTYGTAQYAVAAASDEWGGNFNVIAGGLTAADPA